MLVETLTRWQSYNVQVRQRGQLTIPQKVRDALAIEDGDILTLVQAESVIFLTPKPLRTLQLMNKMADMMEEAGITLDELLEDLPKIREEIYRERYEGKS